MEKTTPKKKIVKGHWPRGKRRNNPRGWAVLVRRLQSFVAERLSARETARAIGVSDRTLRRWLSGEHVGGEQHAAQIREVLARKEW